MTFKTVAIITGGGTGIGLASALALAEKGITPVIIGRRKTILASALKKLKKKDKNAGSFSVDIRNERSVCSAVREITKKYGRIDILVNNAGAAGEGVLLHKTKSALWNEIIDTNITGIFNAAKAVLPVMLKQKSGSIVNVASIAPFIKMSRAAAYCASKAAVVSLTITIALDYKERGITCNCVTPGTIDTDMTSNCLSHYETKKALEALIPLKRVGKPKDVAKLICFLVTQRNDLTGNIIAVDGGLSLG